MSAAVSPVEPTRGRLANPFARYFLATRPAFLGITLAGCMLGFATAIAGGAPFGSVRALATLLLAATAHASVNVLNDYCDHLNGSDARNTQRIYPYTGGSRFIQNGVLTPGQTLAFALALAAITIVGGLWLLTVAGAGLFWIGAVGLLIGWAYSAPPLQLNSRGTGEVSVVAGFLLVVAGADIVQRGTPAALPWLAGMPYALLVGNALYINQFPDRAADRASGKLHWVARLQLSSATWGYALMLALAALTLLGGVVWRVLPAAALLTLVALLPAAAAWRQLRRFAAMPERLGPAIRLTLLAAHMQALALALILLLFRENS